MPSGIYQSVEDIISRYVTMKAEFDRWLYWSVIYKQAYMQNHWQSVPEEGDYQATLPLEALVIDTALALITATPPLLTVVPDDEESDRQINQADKVEKWHIGVDYANIQMEGVDPQKAALFNGLLYGIGWLREVANFPPDWDENPDPDNLTYIQTSIHPSQVFFRMGRVPGGVRTLAYESHFTVQDIEAEWQTTLRLRRDDKGQYMAKDFTEKRLLVDFWEWQTRGGKNTLFHSVFVEDPPQFVKPPTPMDEYKRIPYYPVTCYETGEEKPEEHYLSFLFKLKELPHLAEIVVSRELRMAEMYIDPIMIVKNASGEDIPIIKQPGAVIEITPEDDVHYLQYTGTAPDLPRVRELLLNLTQLSSFSDPILRQGTSDSAVGRATDIEQGMLKLTEPIKHFKRALEQMYWHRAQLAAAFSPDTAIAIYGEDVRGKAFQVKLTGKQIARMPRVNVRIKPQVRDQMLADINIATQAINSGLWSREMAWDFLGVQDKQAAKESIQRDRIATSPEVLQLETQAYMQDLQDELGTAAPAPGGQGGNVLNLPPAPFGDQGGMQPSVQGAGNGVPQQAAGGNVGANPANVSQMMADRIRRQANGPSSVPTVRQ